MGIADTIRCNTQFTCMAIVVEAEWGRGGCDSGPRQIYDSNTRIEDPVVEDEQNLKNPAS